MGERKAHKVSPWVWAVVAALLGIAVLALLDPRGSSGGPEPSEAQLGAVAAEPLLQPARDAGLGRSAPSVEGNGVETTAREPESIAAALPLSHTLIVVDEAGARVSADVTVLGFDFEQRFSVDARADPVEVGWERLPVRIEARTAESSGELALLAMPPDPVIAVTVRPFADLAGVVVDPAGQPVGPGVRVALYDRRYSTAVDTLGVGWTGIDGRFVVQGLPADVPLLAHAGGGGFVGSPSGYTVALDGEDARLVAQYLFGIAIDGSSYERGLEDCSVNQGLIWTGIGPQFRQLVAGHPGLRHLSASWTYVGSKPYGQVLLVAGDRTDPPPVLRVGARGRKGKLQEVPLHRVLEDVVVFRLEAPIESEEATPRDASIALQFSPPPGMERLTSNEVVGQISFLDESLNNETYSLKRDDILFGRVITCLPAGASRVVVSLAGGVVHGAAEGQTLPTVELSRERTSLFVDLSHLTTLEVEAVHPKFGPVRGLLSVSMGRGDVSRASGPRVESSVQRAFSSSPYLVFGLHPGDYWITGQSTSARARPTAVQVSRGGGRMTTVLDLSGGR